LHSVHARASACGGETWSVRRGVVSRPGRMERQCIGGHIGIMMRIRDNGFSMYRGGARRRAAALWCRGGGVDAAALAGLA